MTSSLSAGTNALLRLGATPVTCAADVLELFDLEPVVPTRGEVIATEPIDELLFEIPHYGRHGFDYWHQRLDPSALSKLRLGSRNFLALRSRRVKLERWETSVISFVRRDLRRCAGSRRRALGTHVTQGH
jgi:hypothetical protein